jgi:hypothetical protein
MRNFEEKTNVSNFSDAEYEAYIAGCADTHTVFFDAIDKMREAANDMMSVFMNENMPQESKDSIPVLKSLQVIYSTLSTLAERAQDDYFENLDEKKVQRGDY